MRLDVIDAICEGGRGHRLAHLAFGEAPAKQLADAFFVVAAARAGLDADETKILGKIQDRVNKEIARRNDFAHGDWFWALGPFEGDNPASVVLSRVKPSRKAPASADGFSSADLVGITEHVVLLASWILDVGDACLVESQRPEDQRRRIREFFAMESGAVVRLPVPGPRTGYASYSNRS
jgi:hypothetical protein